MKTAKLSEMTKGWFVGDFEPTLMATQAVEVGLKEYLAGYSEDWHYHRIATEITVIVSGEVEMCGRRFSAGDIIVLSPGEGTAFRAISDALTSVVKIPGAKNDKYLRGQ